MEKTNWIEKIKETIRIAMNKGLAITEYSYENSQSKYIEFENEIGFGFDIQDNLIKIFTSRGKLFINYNFTERDKIEIQSLILSIKEYNEDMAVSELEEFISNKDDRPKDINDLDNEDD